MDFYQDFIKIPISGIINCTRKTKIKQIKEKKRKLSEGAIFQVTYTIRSRIPYDHNNNQHNKRPAEIKPCPSLILMRLNTNYQV